ncbi:hypothetical protein PM082_009701 [Marasmius tenuissimus]|nr:hypothetical protein PM082_009701 [Marasmius tenuissimus]
MTLYRPICVKMLSQSSSGAVVHPVATAVDQVDCVVDEQQLETISENTPSRLATHYKANSLDRTGPDEAFTIEDWNYAFSVGGFTTTAVAQQYC